MKTKRTSTERRRKQSRERVVTLGVQNFAHVSDVQLTLGDLAVLVGPQGAGKSLALQWLKVAMDGKQVIEALRDAGHPVNRPEVVVDLIRA